MPQAPPLMLRLPSCRHVRFNLYHRVHRWSNARLAQSAYSRPFNARPSPAFSLGSPDTGTPGLNILCQRRRQLVCLLIGFILGLVRAAYVCRLRLTSENGLRLFTRPPDGPVHVGRLSVGRQGLPRHLPARLLPPAAGWLAWRQIIKTPRSTFVQCRLGARQRVCPPTPFWFGLRGH